MTMTTGYVCTLSIGSILSVACNGFVLPVACLLCNHCLKFEERRTLLSSERGRKFLETFLGIPAAQLYRKASRRDCEMMFQVAKYTTAR